MKLLALFICSTAWGQTARFDLSPSTPTALIGAPLDFIGAAVFPDHYVLEGPAKDQPTDPFEILGIEAGPPVKKDGGTVVLIRIRVAAFTLGEAVFPALHWTLRAQGGSSDFLSPPVRLNVVGPQPEPNADIKDIAGPIPIRTWPWLLLAAALAACLAYALLRRKRGSVAAASSAPIPDTRSPDQIALDDLRALAAAELPIKEYYDRLSDILRLYLDRRFALPALQMTTSDLLRRMARNEIEPAARTRTKTLLDRCDLAKFARFLPTKEESIKDCDAAVEIVSMTRPAPAMEEHATSGGSLP